MEITKTERSFYKRVYNVLKEKFLITPNKDFSAFHYADWEDIKNHGRTRNSLYAPFSISYPKVNLYTQTPRAFNDDNQNDKFFVCRINRNHLSFKMEITETQPNVYYGRNYTYEEVIEAMARDFTRNAFYSVEDQQDDDVKKLLLNNELDKLKSADAIEIVSFTKNPLAEFGFKDADIFKIANQSKTREEEEEEEEESRCFETYEAIFYKFTNDKDKALARRWVKGIKKEQSGFSESDLIDGVDGKDGKQN